MCWQCQDLKSSNQLDFKEKEKPPATGGVSLKIGVSGKWARWTLLIMQKIKMEVEPNH